MKRSTFSQTGRRAAAAFLMVAGAVALAACSSDAPTTTYRPSASTQGQPVYRGPSQNSIATPAPQATPTYPAAPAPAYRPAPAPAPQPAPAPGGQMACGKGKCG